METFAVLFLQGEGIRGQLMLHSDSVIKILCWDLTFTVTIDFVLNCYLVRSVMSISS